MTTDWPDFNDRWDYTNPEETEKVFRRILSEGMISGDWRSEERDYYLQLKTQIGRTLGLQGRFEEALAILRDL